MAEVMRWLARALSVLPILVACNSVLRNEGREMVEAGDATANGGVSSSAGGSQANTASTGAAGGGSTGEASGVAAGGQGGEDNSTSVAGAAGERGAGGTRGAGASAGGAASGGTGGDASGDPSGDTGAGARESTSAATGGGGPSCDPGPEPETEEACCSTGTRTRTVTLDAQSCTYGLGNWNACSVEEVCTPGTTKACPNGDSCGVVRCSDACNWGSCEPKDGAECLRIREPNGNDGSNYTCCDTAGMWKFCLQNCQWSNSCANCAPGSPDWCEC